MTQVHLAGLMEFAIRLSLAEFAANQPTETLAAYAICTDDELSTLFWVATTNEHILTVEEVVFRYSAVEWPYGYGSSAFDAPRLELVRLHAAALESGLFQAHVADSFHTLVEALQRARRSGEFGEDILLYVASTDPSEHLEALEGRGVEYLNNHAGINRWKTTLPTS
jgi:hypothetical protein